MKNNAYRYITIPNLHVSQLKPSDTSLQIHCPFVFEKVERNYVIGNCFQSTNLCAFIYIYIYIYRITNVIWIFNAI